MFAFFLFFSSSAFEFFNSVLALKILFLASFISFSALFFSSFKVFSASCIFSFALLYISRERGSSKLGSGKINYYMYVNKELINSEYYIVAYMQVSGAKELKCYKDDYDKLIDNVKDKIELIEEERKQARYNEIYNKANEKIQDAEKTLKY